MYYGAGILTINCSSFMGNNTITQNVCTSTASTAKGAGLYNSTAGAFNGANNIVFDNHATLEPEFSGSMELTYSCSSMPLAGMGNIVDDPEFVNPDLDNFNLLAISPCIDTGDPTSPLDPDGSRADMGALYFDQTGGGLLIPNTPTAFNVQHNNTQLAATLTWINPAITANQLPLTELNGVKVYRADALIATLTNMVIGAPASYTDNSVPAIGMWEYEIVPYNSHGDGISADETAWIGLDIPGLPTNVVATPDPGQGLSCLITWTAPTSGAHGGYWPAGSWTGQKVYRNGNLIVTLTGTNTSYNDTSVPQNGWYTYSLSYYNSSGEGELVNASPSPVYVGPPQFQQIAYNWVEISGIGVNTGITGDDQNLGPFNLGFTFPWYAGSGYSSLRVCSNGFVSFTSTATTYVNTGIPNVAEPNNLVAALWDDLYPPGGGTVWYYYDAQTPRFIIEWDNVMSYSTPRTPQKFEIILYPDGTIDIMYHTVQAPCANANTVGIENGSGTEGIQVTFDGSGPLEPANSMGIRIFTVWEGNPNITLGLGAGPIQIPASGGSFDYNISVANTGSTPQTGQVWCMVGVPNGLLYGPVIGPMTLTLPAGISLSRIRTQNVPGSAPPGTYYYYGYLGLYPSTISAWDSFPFTKLTTGEGPGIEDWTNSGESFDEWLATAPDALPTEYSLQQNFPNPFNPLTTISYALPEAARVTISLYDLSGRLVAKLVDGWREAGAHQVAFDGTGLASGVYLYRLQANDFTAGGKMVLMK